MKVCRTCRAPFGYQPTERGTPCHKTPKQCKLKDLPKMYFTWISTSFSFMFLKDSTFSSYFVDHFLIFFFLHLLIICVFERLITCTYTEYISIITVAWRIIIVVYQVISVFKVYMTQKIFSAYLTGLSKYRRMAFFFLFRDIDVFLLCKLDLWWCHNTATEMW